MKTTKILLILSVLLLAMGEIHSVSAISLMEGGLQGSSSSLMSGGSSYGSSNSGNMMIFGRIINVIIAFVVFIILKKFLTGGKKTITQMVVTKYNINKDDDVPVTIEGRKGGLLNFILAHLKVDNRVKFTISNITKEVKNEVYDFNGFANTTLQSENVSYTEVGYSRNFMRLLIGIIISIALMFYVHPVFGILVLGICGYLYYISKMTSIKIQTQGGAWLILHFSASVIEGKSIKIKEVTEIEAILNNHHPLGKK